jgi:hypothetical protein
MFADATSINLAGSWSTAWSSLSGPLGSFVTFLGVIGTMLVIGALVVYFWERRRGGGSHTKLIWTALVGCILAGPDIVLPSILTLFDFAANAFWSLLHNTSGSSTSIGVLHVLVNIH